MTHHTLALRRLAHALPDLLARIGLAENADAFRLGLYSAGTEAEILAVRRFLRRTLRKVSRLAVREGARLVPASEASELVETLTPVSYSCGHVDDKRGHRRLEDCPVCCWPAWAYKDTPDDPWRPTWYAEAISRACLSILIARGANA